MLVDVLEMVCFSLSGPLHGEVKYLRYTYIYTIQ